MYRGHAVAVTLAVAVSAVGASAAPAASGAGGAPCHTIDVSPSRWVCAALYAPTPDVPRALVVSTSRDRGRTWRSVSSTGIVVTSSTLLAQVALAADPAADPTVFLQTNEGLFSSTDDGATFVLADRLGANSNVFAQLKTLRDPAVAAPGGVASSTRFAFAAPLGSPALVQPPFHLPVAGSPDIDSDFLVPPPGSGPHRDVLVAAVQPDASSPTPQSRPVIYACDAQLACGTARFAFPMQSRYRGAVLSPDFRTTGVAYVWTLDATTGDLTVWRTTDAARTFVPWRAADRLTAPINRAKPAGQGWDLSIAIDPRRPTTLYARTLYIRPKAGGPPTEQLFRSDDGGRRWTLVAKTGTAPWHRTGSASPAYGHAVFVAPNGHVLVLGAAAGYTGVFCSADRGRRWSRSCPR